MAAVANKRSVMTLYSDAQHTLSQRVRIVLAEKNISVEIVDVDPSQLSDEFLEINPYGNLPTLVDRDLVLYESRIIMEYLDERFPHPPLLPVDPVSRARSRLLMYRVEYDWYPLAEAIRDPDSTVAAQARHQLRESLIAVTPVFAAKPFFMSDELTLVDCSVAPLLWRLPNMGIDLPEHTKALKQYATRMFALASFQTSLSEQEKELR